MLILELKKEVCSIFSNRFCFRKSRLSQLLIVLNGFIMCNLHKMGDEIKDVEIGGTNSMHGEYKKYKPIEHIWL